MATHARLALSLSFVAVLFVSAASRMFLSAQRAASAPVTDRILQDPSPNDWVTWRGSSRSLGYSGLDQVNRRTVNQLQLAWSWTMEPGASQSAPIVYDGVMYLPNAGGTVQALDAATGELLWEYRHLGRDGKPRGGTVKGVSIYDDMVYVNTPDARIVALKAQTGKVVWDVQVADPAKGFRYDSTSVIARGKVISGLAGCSLFILEKCAITGHDAKTGKELWRTQTIPKPDEPGGDSWGNVDYLYRSGTGMWGSGGYDPDLNLVYWWTSQAKPWTRAARGTDGDALYGNTTLALDPDTGKIVWYRQMLPGETHDLEDGFESILLNNGSRKSLFKMGKIGILWELDRKTGQILHATDLGYQNIVTVDPNTGKAEYRPEMIPKLDVPISFCPGQQGVRSWPAMAYAPETQAFYIPVELGCVTIAFGDVKKVEGGGGNGGGPRTASLHPKSDGYLAEFVALTPSGKVLWRHRQHAPFTSGALTTAGGLVFVGDWNRYIRAYDVQTGQELWQTRATTAVEGFPLTYAVGGRQYVAFPVGAGASSSWFRLLDMQPNTRRPPAGNAIMVFALPKAVSPGR